MSKPLLHWALMTPDDLDAAIEHLPLALVPCGSLEWHGPHLATGSDWLRGDAICTGVAERLDGGVVLPSLWVAAPGFCNWRGTVSFTPALVKQVAAELYRELDKCGFRYVLMHLSHAGAMQREAWGEPAQQYMKNSDMVILVQAGPSEQPESSLGGGHAGASEAAEMLVSEAAGVHLDRYDPEDTLLPKYDGCDPELYSEGLTDQSRESVYRFMAREHYEWDPGLAEKVTPEAARKLFDEICDGLADDVRTMMGLTA